MSYLNTVDTSVSIAGAECHFVKMTLKQGFNSHHTFEVEVNYEELDGKWMENPVKMIQMIGDEVVIAMKHKVTGEENLFSGIITDVSMVGNHGQNNNIIISGCSPTIRLEGKKTLDSFMDKSLDLIAKETVANSGNGSEVTIDPVFTEKISYICQHSETAFEFLNRLSWLYGEWFFYDGAKTYFGKPEMGDETEITYDVEMDHFNLTARLIPSKVNRHDYLPQDDKEVETEAPETVDGVRGYIKAALDKSYSIYTSNAELHMESLIASQQDLENLIKVEKSRDVGSMLVLKGNTKTCKIKIGKVVQVKLPSTMPVTVKDVEKFLITEIEHTVDEKGYYRNKFEGIPADIENIPMEAIPTPIANPQIATVKDNADPFGRVKVQLQWQKKKQLTTNWLRVQTPDAGSSDKVSSNRGFVFVPETGDMVMIGFEYGDPSRPFVMGSLLTTKTGVGGGDGNKTKSMTTRSGSTVKLDDSTGNVLIADQTGNNFMTIDGTDKITISTAKTIEITNGKSAMVIDDETIVISSKTIVIEGGEVATMVSGKEAMIVSGKESMAVVDGTAVTVNASAKVGVIGGEEAELTSPKAVINGDNNLDITSGLVKINS